jgi:predicted membrane protein
MVQKQDLSFAKIPAGILWIVNIFHAPFLWWIASVGGSGMEMMTLLPICFIQMPSVLILLISAICMLIARKNKKIVVENLIPALIYIGQVAAFWFFAINY